MAENSIRAVAVAHKNFLFSDTPQGAKASALAFSVIETAKANGLDPYEYFVYLFRNLPNLDFYNKPELLEGLLPWADSLPEFCYVKTYFSLPKMEIGLYQGFAVLKSYFPFPNNLPVMRFSELEAKCR